MIPSTRVPVEALEARIAPANAVLLTTANSLQTFDTETPGTAGPVIPVLGLVAGDILVGIDFRPSTGGLYGLGVNGVTAHLYVVDVTTGEASLVGGNIALPQSAGAAGGETDFGFDFNPVADAIRVVANNRDNFRINPNTGLVTGADSALNPGTPVIVGAAYTNSLFGATSTTLFDLDSTTDQLFVQGGNPVPPGTSPNVGTLSLVGNLGLDISNEAGFDIAPDGTAFAALQVGGVSGLYTINLTTGLGTIVANFAAGTIARDIAIAPPAVSIAANGKSATYIDSDGDTVTIKTTRGSFEASDFQLIATNATGGAQLTRILLGDDASEFQGANLTISVTKKKGDGLANVGFLDATGVDLGKVTINGDLGRILAGDSDLATAGVKQLKMRSMGAFGSATQGGVSSIQSNVEGVIQQLLIARDFIDANLVINGDDGRIAKLSIGGDIVGGLAASSGRIEVDGIIDTVFVRGRIIGGPGEDSGALRCLDDVTRATLGGIVGGVGDDSGLFEGSPQKLVIRGSIIGGTGSEGGALESEGDSGTITIKGTIQGGSGFQSGRLDLDDFVRLTVGSIVGGNGDESGRIDAENGDIFVSGTVLGGLGLGSGKIASAENLGKVTVLGSVIGRSDGSGSISAEGRIGTVTIGGNLVGAGADGGSIAAAAIDSIRIAGDFVGGSSDNESAQGRIFVTGSSGPEPIAADVGSIHIGGNIIGGAFESGRIEVDGKIGSLTVGGSIIGNAGNISGSVDANEIGKVRIGRDLQGGGGAGSGSITSNNLGPIFIGGDVRGGAGSLSGQISSGLFSIEKIRINGSLIGGGSDGSGQIIAGAQIGDVFIGGDVLGSGFANTGKISATQGIGFITIGGNLVGGNFGVTVARADSGLISATTIAGVSIGGSFIAGTSFSFMAPVGTSGGIIAQTLGPVRIAGDIIGSATNFALIVCAGQQDKPASGSDVALASLTVRGDVQFAQILAGFSAEGLPINADASIGPVKVGGDWRASTLVAGAQDAGAPGFGNGDVLQSVNDTSLVARIAKITIGGDVLGSTTIPGDIHGFVAEQIDSFTVGGRKLTLTAGPNNDQLISIGASNEVKLDEVGLP